MAGELSEAVEDALIAKLMTRIGVQHEQLFALVLGGIEPGLRDWDILDDWPLESRTGIVGKLARIERQQRLALVLAREKNYGPAVHYVRYEQKLQEWERRRGR